MSFQIDLDQIQVEDRPIGPLPKGTYNCIVEECSLVETKATLESSADGVDFTALWTKSGNQGDQWNQATVFTPTGGHKWLRFTCVPNCC